MTELLARAAELAADGAVDVDAFMRAAWTAFLGASAGLRERLEEMQLRHQLEELRKLGRVSQA